MRDDIGGTCIEAAARAPNPSLIERGRRAAANASRSSGVLAPRSLSRTASSHGNAASPARSTSRRSGQPASASGGKAAKVSTIGTGSPS
jgi:hypothetical protein